MNNIDDVIVSFVIPCLNEEETLHIVIGYVKEAIQDLDINCEIVVSDNGSTDRSIEVAESLGARVVNAPDKGYGNALIHGFKSAKGKILVMADADGTYDFRESAQFVRIILETDEDLVIGSRLKGNIEKDAMPKLHRYLGTPILSFLIRMFFNINISDCNCGLRAFKKEAYEKMKLISGGMEFASEMLIKSGILGLKIKEIPCSLYKDKRTKKPHLKTWRDGWRHFKYIFLFAPKILFFYPGIILFSLGAIPTIILFWGRIEIGSFSFDSYFMVFFSLFLFIGYQLLWLYKFTIHFSHFIGFREYKINPDFLDMALIFSVILIVFSLIMGTYSSVDWLTTGASPLHKTRILILSIDIFFIGIITILNSFLVALFNIATITISKNYKE